MTDFLLSIKDFFDPSAILGAFVYTLLFLGLALVRLRAWRVYRSREASGMYTTR